MPRYFIRCHFWPFFSSTSKEVAMLRWLPRPTESSQSITGRPRIARNSR